jgi:hypothetical protein
LVAEVDRCTGIKISVDEASEFFRSHLSRLLEVLPRAMSYDRITIETDAKGPHIGKKPIALKFSGKEMKISEWREVVRKFCDILADENRDHFPLVLELLRADRRTYFTRDESKLTDGYLVPNTDIWVETNLSANNTMEFCNKLANAFGYPIPPDIVV